MRRVTKKLLTFLLGVFFTTIYCEWIIYYVVVAQCSWPSIKNSQNNNPVKALIFADTHLLGPFKGHWFDKWRREWQMHQAYQAIITIHSPDMIFVLGDLFDEGDRSNDEQFGAYVDRFHKLFPVPSESVMHVVAGNHDIGFHNYIRRGNAPRFIEKLNSSLVQLISVKDNHIVLINSMAMEGDRCNMCTKARNDIVKISEIFKCAENSEFCYDDTIKLNYSRPILMQHFPLYRLSDAGCNDSDAPPLPEKNKLFRYKMDSLSLEATNFLATKIKPRVVFGGHTHHGCVQYHKYTEPNVFEFYEYSVPSFSWRNRPNPKFMLVMLTPDEYSVSKCGLPQETTIVLTAVVMLFILSWQVKKIKHIGR